MGRRGDGMKFGHLVNDFVVGVAGVTGVIWAILIMVFGMRNPKKYMRNILKMMIQEDSRQLSLFGAPGEVEVEDAVRNPYPETDNALDYLKMLCTEKESLVFLWGQNPHLCFIQSHSSRETKSGLCIDRTKAQRVLRKAGYTQRSDHINGKDKARVYWRLEGRISG